MDEDAIRRYVAETFSGVDVEVSTPEAEDVVRIADRYGRASS